MRPKLCLLFSSGAFIKLRQNVTYPLCKSTLEDLGLKISSEEYKLADHRARIGRRGFKLPPGMSPTKDNEIHGYHKQIFRFLIRDPQKLELVARANFDALRDISNFELRHDVKPFFELMKSRDWPWETFLAIMEDDYAGHEFLAQLGLKDSVPDSATSANTIASFDAIIEREENVFSRIRQVLQNKRPDHQEFEHLYVATNLGRAMTGIRAAYLANYPTVGLRTFNTQDLNPDAITTVGKHRVSKVYSKKVVPKIVRFEGVARINHLCALRHWEPKYWERLTPIMKDISNSK